MVKYIILFIMLSAMFRSIEQIHFFRPNLTWLPPWVYSSGGRLNIDGYHISSALNIWCMFAAGYFFYIENISLWWVILLWLIHGNTFSLFYHVIFMKPDHRDNFFLNWLKDLLGVIGR